MKICQQRVHDLKLKRRKNKNARFARINIEFFSVLCGDAFENANGRRSDGDDAIAGFFRFIHGANRFVAKFESFLVHFVRVKRFGFDGHESSEADGQSDKANFHAARANLAEQFGRKMQTRRRRGD